MPFGPALEQRDPLCSHPWRQFDANVGNADVALRVEPVSRGVPELQVLREVKLADQRLGTLQDYSQTGSDINDFELISPVVRRAGTLKELKLLPERLYQAAITPSYSP